MVHGNCSMLVKLKLSVHRIMIEVIVNKKGNWDDATCIHLPFSCNVLPVPVAAEEVSDNWTIRFLTS